MNLTIALKLGDEVIFEARAGMAPAPDGKVDTLTARWMGLGMLKDAMNELENYTGGTVRRPAPPAPQPQAVACPLNGAKGLPS